MLDVISNNPFRILGVFSNTRTSEIVRNVGKIKAYTNVEKVVAFPTDLDYCLGPICRSNEALQTAQSSISTQEDRVRYALFWFSNENEIDQKAFEMLARGEKDAAFNLWRDNISPSSIHNIAILSLINGNYSIAIWRYNTLFHYYSARESFLSTILEDSKSFSAFDLSKILITELLKELEPKKLLDLYSDSEDYSKPSTPLLSFAKEHGKMKVATFVDEDGTSRKCCLFEEKDGTLTYVYFESKELSPSEIVEHKEDLFICQYSWGSFYITEWDNRLTSELDYIKEQGLSRPINSINNRISSANKDLADDKGQPDSIINSLISDTYRDLLVVKELEGDGGLTYSSIADKVSKTIIHGIPDIYKKCTLPDLEKCAKALAFLDFAETLSTSESNNQLCDKNRQELVAIQDAYLPILPSLVRDEERSVRCLIEKYYQKRIDIDDARLTTKDEGGNYVTDYVHDKPLVLCKRVDQMSSDSFLHECASLLYSIKLKLEPELDQYRLFSSQIVRSLYNSLVNGVNTNLDLDQWRFNEFLELKNKYRNSNEYFQCKHIYNRLYVSYTYPEIGKLLSYEDEYGDGISVYDDYLFNNRVKRPSFQATKRFKEYLSVVLSDMNNLAQFDMDTDFRAGIFEPNKNSIRSLFISVGGLGEYSIKEADINMMTPREKEEERKNKTLWGRLKKRIIS